MSRKGVRLLAVAVVTALAVGVVPSAFAAEAPASDSPAAAPAAASAATKDPFFTYDGSKPLDSYAPGEVLKKRTLQYHVLGIPTPVKAVQLLYRTADAQGRAVANVTSVLRAPGSDGSKAVSYQSFYDSLDPEDGPSRAIAGNVSLGGLLPNVESLLITPLLLRGYDVVVADTQGPTADLLVGPAYGAATLDSLRAATRGEGTGLNSSTRIGLTGYSGGGLATNWAAALAPEYAPEINDRLVGFAEGGPPVNVAHLMKYIDGSLVWSGIIPHIAIGTSRAYGVDLKPYLNSYGRKLYDRHEHASIVNGLGRYPGLTWKKMAKPGYENPNSVPGLTAAWNKLNLGSAPTPTIPGLIVQGNAGQLEGTFKNVPGIGAGDGVIPSGDVRALARQYCATGNDTIRYRQYNLLSHNTGIVPYATNTLGWLADRFEGRTAPSDCGRIPAGNSLAPEVPTKPS